MIEEEAETPVQFGLVASTAFGGITNRNWLYAESRYEIKGVSPLANIINKLADALGTSVDFLIISD